MSSKPTVKDLQEKIDKYFTRCEMRKAPYSIAGLANALGMSSDKLMSYGKGKRNCKTICKAREAVIQNWEERALASGSSGLSQVLKRYGLNEKLVPEEEKEIIINFGVPVAGYKYVPDPKYKGERGQLPDDEVYDDDGLPEVKRNRDAKIQLGMRNEE